MLSSLVNFSFPPSKGRKGTHARRDPRSARFARAARVPAGSLASLFALWKGGKEKFNKEEKHRQRTPTKNNKKHEPLPQQAFDLARSARSARPALHHPPPGDNAFDHRRFQLPRPSTHPGQFCRELPEPSGPKICGLPGELSSGFSVAGHAPDSFWPSMQKGTRPGRLPLQAAQALGDTPPKPFRKLEDWKRSVDVLPSRFCNLKLDWIIY